MSETTCTRALKEWAVVTDALASGDQVILLRKGGIADVGGEFRLESERFALWPTYLHQDTDWLRPDETHRLARTLAARGAEDVVRLAWFAQVDSVLVVPSRASLDDLADEHVWSAAYLDQRWQYRPELPLYLLLLRVSELAGPVTLHETEAQRGCRSWVDFEPPVSLAGMRAVLSDDTFRLRAEGVREQLLPE
ncbi:MAG: DUF1802 family protein [Armatimonadetes bacterium]|nr:DUF1802 family protein [Armatimonadota bacterium]